MEEMHQIGGSCIACDLSKIGAWKFVQNSLARLRVLTSGFAIATKVVAPVRAVVGLLITVSAHRRFADGYWFGPHCSTT